MTMGWDAFSSNNNNRVPIKYDERITEDKKAFHKLCHILHTMNNEKN
jgi:hypothetical protein